MSNFFKIKDRTADWLVRVVGHGEGYGKWNSKTQEFACVNKRPPEEGVHTMDTLVEFYDMANTSFEPFEAQYVSRYRLCDFLKGSGGINLAGEEPKWALSDVAAKTIRLWLESGVSSTDYSDPIIAERVTVAGRNDGNSNPVLKTFNVFLRQSEYDLGEHWDKAEAMARDAGVEGPYVSFDSSEDHGIVSASEACQPDNVERSNKRDREADVQLIALRWFQECIGGKGYDMSHLADIADPDSISSEEIDDLCEKINFGS